MTSVFQRAALGGLLLLAAGAAAAGVSVTFTEPDKFADVPFSSIERARVLDDLSRHISKLASKLPAGQELKIEVLDIDLAGRIDPNTRGRDDLRVLQGGADWPQMRLRYSLQQDGKVLKAGEERLSDMNYLNRPGYLGNDTSLRYEKQMLESWFRSTLLRS